jgi:hypothetical protein
VLEWLPVFARPDTVGILLPSWQYHAMPAPPLQRSVRPKSFSPPRGLLRRFVFIIGGRENCVGTLRREWEEWIITHLRRAISGDRGPESCRSENETPAVSCLVFT